MLKQIPNMLTVSRVLIIPVIIAVMSIDRHAVLSSRIAAVLFIYACITDFLDGFFARLFKASSAFGRVLDPIADKLLIASIMIILVHQKKADFLPAIAIVCREILVSGLREFLAKLSVSMPVSRLAKFKTFIQMLAIIILVLGDEGSGLPFINSIGRIALWIAAGLTLFTGYAYLKASYKYFLVVKKQKI
jgi:CDP-diacylglycerol--glycerol-3-phosphate 3-phosphatidyltransferase